MVCELARLPHFLQGQPHGDACDLLNSTQIGRTCFATRLAIIMGSWDHLKLIHNVLDAILEDRHILLQAFV